jgi:hypothetical protein
VGRFALLLVPALLATAPAGAATRVLLGEVGSVEGIDDAAIATLNRMLEGEVARGVPDVELVTLRAVRANLEVAEMADCLGDEEAAECAAELGNAMGVDLIANPHLGRLGSQVVMTLSIYRLGDATVAGQATRHTDDAGLLLSEVRPLVEEAFGMTGLRVLEQQATPVERSEPAPAPERASSLLPWIVAGAGFGLGGATVVTGAVIHGIGLVGLAGPYERGELGRDEAKLWEDTAPAWLITPWVLYGVGGTLAIAGIAGAMVLE